MRADPSMSKYLEDWDCTFEIGESTFAKGDDVSIRIKWKPNKRGGFNKAAASEFPLDLLGDLVTFAIQEGRCALTLSAHEGRCSVALDTTQTRAKLEDHLRP